MHQKIKSLEYVLIKGSQSNIIFKAFWNFYDVVLLTRNTNFPCNDSNYFELSQYLSVIPNYL